MTLLSLNDEQKLIVDRLVGGYPQRDIVPIVGMPGIGKTTLAKKVYNSWTVVHYFHIRGVVLVRFIKNENYCLRF